MYIYIYIYDFCCIVHMLFLKIYTIYLHIYIYEFNLFIYLFIYLFIDLYIYSFIYLFWILKLGRHKKTGITMPHCQWALDCLTGQKNAKMNFKAGSWSDIPIRKQWINKYTRTVELRHIFGNEKQMEIWACLGLSNRWYIKLLLSIQCGKCCGSRHRVDDDGDDEHQNLILKPRTSCTC